MIKAYSLKTPSAADELLILKTKLQEIESRIETEHQEIEHNNNQYSGTLNSVIFRPCISSEVKSNQDRV